MDSVLLRVKDLLLFAFGILQSDFTLELVSTFLGALFAFLFTFYLYRRKRTEDFLIYTKYTVACLAEYLGAAYCLKKQHTKPRTALLAEVSNREDKTHINLKQLSLKILNGQRTIEIDISKLNPIADYNPNILMLLIAAINSSKHLSVLIDELNTLIDRFYENPDEKNIHLVLSINNNLISQTDWTLALTEKTINVLRDFLKDGHGIDYGNVELTEEIDAGLKPNPIESYERQYWGKLSNKKRKRKQDRKTRSRERL